MNPEVETFVPIPSASENHGDIIHVVCCMADLTDISEPNFCGSLADNLEPVNDRDVPCVVCDDISNTTDLCPRGGRCTQ